ncbi:hypothetical protein LX32DRAFT_40763 [Colletotrichum zoysiae]|uniref:Uncharacterized protein n=1 Tax=Colletotrichum zoysiae TaxID=1216348 RepID=A0AAD9HCN0_9PEZI|nr:hypothetical protein LX32DRAFT_40763 [Colletotrichum zoysiae]
MCREGRTVLLLGGGPRCIASLQSRCWRGPVVGFSCQWLTKVVSVSRVPYFGPRDRNPYRDGAGKNTRESR